MVRKFARIKYQKKIWNNKRKSKEDEETAAPSQYVTPTSPTDDNTNGIDTKSLFSDQEDDQTVETNMFKKRKSGALDEEDGEDDDGVMHKVGDAIDTLWVGTLDVFDSDVFIGDMRDEWIYFKEKAYLYSVYGEDNSVFYGGSDVSTLQLG